MPEASTPPSTQNAGLSRRLSRRFRHRWAGLTRWAAACLRGPRLGLLACTGLLLALLAWQTALEYQQRLEMAADQLLLRTEDYSRELQAQAAPAQAHVRDLRRLMELNWVNPPSAGPDLARALGRRLAAGRPDGWSLDSASAADRERFGQFWWAPPDASPPAAEWLNRAALFLQLARLAHERNPMFSATWFAGAQVNTSFGYPWVPTPTMLRAFGLDSLQAVAGPRAAGVAHAQQQLATDPQDIFFWGRPYVGQMDGRLVISHGAALVVNGQYVGEVSIDFRIEALQQKAETWAASGTRSWIADEHHILLADSRQPLAKPEGDGRANQPVVVELANRLAELGIGPSALRGDEARSWRQQVPGGLLLGAHEPGSPWQVLQFVTLQDWQALVWPELLPRLWLAMGVLLCFGLALRGLALAERAQARLEHLRQAQARRLQQNLMAQVAHELNNPLAIVTGRASLLADSLSAAWPESSQAREAATIRDAAQRCGQIVRRLVALVQTTQEGLPASSATGGPVAAFGPSSLQAVFQTVLEMLAPRLEQAGFKPHQAGEDIKATVDAPSDLLGPLLLDWLEYVLHSAEPSRFTALGKPLELPAERRKERRLEWSLQLKTAPNVDANGDGYVDGHVEARAAGGSPAVRPAICLELRLAALGSSVADFPEQAKPELSEFDPRRAGLTSFGHLQRQAQALGGKLESVPLLPETGIAGWWRLVLPVAVVSAETER